MVTIGVFPKWISPNSVNHYKFKIGMVTTGTTYLDAITCAVIVRENISFLPLGRYLLPLTTLNRYQSRGSNRNSVFTTSSENVTNISHGVFPGNHTTFRLCHDSLNSLNSVTFSGKLNWSLCATMTTWTSFSIPISGEARKTLNYFVKQRYN